MPEITVTHIAIVVGALIIGVILGWVARASRAASEKEVISKGWQEQLAAQRSEHDRLLDQNKSLMEQVKGTQVPDFIGDRLNKLATMTSMLRDSEWQLPDEETQREFLGIILQQAGQLAQLVNNLLSISRISSTTGVSAKIFATISSASMARAACASSRPALA